MVRVRTIQLKYRLMRIFALVFFACAHSGFPSSGLSKNSCFFVVYGTRFRVCFCCTLVVHHVLLVSLVLASVLAYSAVFTVYVFLYVYTVLDVISVVSQSLFASGRIRSCTQEALTWR